MEARRWWDDLFIGNSHCGTHSGQEPHIPEFWSLYLPQTERPDFQQQEFHFSKGKLMYFLEIKLPGLLNLQLFALMEEISAKAEDIFAARKRWAISHLPGLPTLQALHRVAFCKLGEGWRGASKGLCGNGYAPLVLKSREQKARRLNDIA